MQWNQAVYNQFKNLRFKPFFDLMALIQPDGLCRAVDMGCGTSEQTRILAECFPQVQFYGFDASREMLQLQQYHDLDNLVLGHQTIESFVSDDAQYDLIFSNAALQWMDNHRRLFPKIIDKLTEQGQIAIQMPLQTENILNRLLYQLANEEPYSCWFNHWNQHSPVLRITDYAQILFDAGLSNLDISVRVYPQTAASADELLQFISGSALIPYLERLNAEQQEQFIDEFMRRIQHAFVTFPALYPFQRILIYGRK